MLPGVFAAGEMAPEDGVFGTVVAPPEAKLELERGGETSFSERVPEDLPRFGV